MNSPKLNEEYAELWAYSNIHYTPAWYRQKFPGFLNVDCYRILVSESDRWCADERNLYLV